MKVNWDKVANTVFTALILSTSYAGYVAIRDAKDHKSITDIKTEIRQKDIKRYDSLINHPPIRNSYEDWEYEARIMNDSIKADSMAKKAYFEGAQMVRDSLYKATNK